MLYGWTRRRRRRRRRGQQGDDLADQEFDHDEPARGPSPVQALVIHTNVDSVAQRLLYDVGEREHELKVRLA